MKTRNKRYDKSRLRLLCLLTALLGIFGAGQTWAQTQPSGAGTQASPYQISTADELRWFANQVNSGSTGAWATLTADINLGEEAWTPIGNYSASTSLMYTGTFDGAGHTISNLTVDNSSADYQGFVGRLGSGGAIQNLTLDENCSVSGKEKVGGICGSNYGTIANCSNTGKVTGSYYVGGLCGENRGTLTNCSNSGTVTGISQMGGVSGYNSSTLTNCSNTGTVTGSYYVGGVCGYNSSINATLTNCSNTGTVSGNSYYVGGVCGYNYNATITNCSNTGTVSCSSNVGGVCSRNSSGTITNCYWLDTSASTGIGSGSGTNVASKTAEEFASGEVAYLLNGSASENVSWYQNLNNGQTVDEYPVLDSSHGTVYHAIDCKSEEVYSNSPINDGHQYDADGVCTVCGGYQPAELNEARVYEISNAGQLFWFAGLVNGDTTQEDITEANPAASAVLLNNITIPADMAWTPIGNETTVYTGTFDGQNHTISGMKIDNADGYSGLFGNVTGTVRDFTVTGSITISSGVTGLKVGGAVGSLGTGTAGGTVSGVSSGVDITVTTGKGHIGGVVGSMPENSSPTVESCMYTGTLTSSVDADCMAGVVGYIRTGTIQNCANQGKVSVSGSGNVGGVLGYCNNKDITIRNCYNTGSITGSGTNTVGAIVGQNKGTQATVSNCCYLTGSADKGQGQLDTDAAGTAVKTADEFKSGAVSVLLQGDQTAQAWGQTLGTDNYPVLTADEAKRVYAAKLYNGSVDDVTDVYANASGFSLPEGNALLVIEGAVSASTGTNIVVKNGEAYTCANLVLTDGADFYTPVAFTAAQATYSRPLADGTQWGTVALPFDATTVTGAELFRVASQDGDALYVDETNGMAGGEPLVFRANAEVTTVDFKGTDVTVRATDAEAGSTLLKGTSQTVSPLAEGAYFIYGDKFYRVASGSQVGMKAFRAYIPAAAGDLTRSRSAGAASQLRIVFNADK